MRQAFTQSESWAGMRFVAAKNLKQGMVVGKNFYNNSMNVLLRKGVTLTDSHIRTINRINISGIYIDDALTRDIIIQPLIDDDLKLKFAGEVRSIFLSVKSKVRPEADRFEDILKTIIEQISSKPNHIVNMFELKSLDNYTFQHSIDVCILSVVMGLARQLSAHLLFNLALSAVYHDIGMMFLDAHILAKPGPPTDEDTAIIKTHPTVGMEFAKKINIHRNDILQGILQHHERYDGTGYPAALVGERISLFGRIIAIADVFDTLTSEHAYSHAMLPSEAVEFIMAGAGRLFDFELTRLFINNVSAYPTGITVRLSNGLTGIVAENYAGYTLRPLIKILPDNPSVPPFFINLKDDLSVQNVTIVAVVA